MQKKLNEQNESEKKSNGAKQSVSLSSPGICKAVAKRILEDVDNYCATEYDDGHRNHLGASLIGNECKRYLWYVFRWVYAKRHSGRQQRLFNRGHREEDRFIEWLRGTGCQIWTHDESKAPNEKGEFPQYRISGANGHFGGSLDGIAMLPEHYEIKEPVLCEFKTSNTGAFKKVLEDGMIIAKHQHFAQTSVYGKKYGFQYCLYLCINKNDDDLHIELVKLDHNLGTQMEMKAEQVIASQVAPARLSNNPTFFNCKFCDMREVCHEGKPAEVNCRSCANATPVENAEWFCSSHNAIVPKEYIKQACGNYTSICYNEG